MTEREIGLKELLNDDELYNICEKAGYTIVKLGDKYQLHFLDFEDGPGWHDNMQQFDTREEVLAYVTKQTIMDDLPVWRELSKVLARIK